MATCLNGVPADLDDLARAAEAVGGEGFLADALDQVAEAIRDVDTSNIKDLDLDDPMDMGYTLKSMQVALWCTRQDTDFERILVAIVNRGGDTDSNGAVAGAVMGALCGASQIPARWLDNIHDAERLTDLADRLFEKVL
jgi:ADP-ribosylglycohydrolase